MQKLLTFFQQNFSIFAIFNDQSFNDTLTTDSFEKLGPEIYIIVVINPAIQEYEALKNKYKIEKGCRYQAQSYATQIVQQNQKLKRQSMGLLNLVGNNPQLSLASLDIDLDSEEPNLEDDYKEKLNEMIRG